MQEGGDGREGEDEEPLGEGEDAEEGVPGKGAGGAVGGAVCEGVAEGREEEDQGGEREGADGEAVEGEVEAPFAAATSADGGEDEDAEDGAEAAQEAPGEDGSVVRGVLRGDGRADTRGDGEERRGGVRGAQPGDDAAAVPEAGAGEGGRVARDLRVMGGGRRGGPGVGRGPGVVRRGGKRSLVLVRAPGLVREEPEEQDERGGDERGEGQAAAGLGPPVAR
ncbi:syndecan 1 [Streptomyces sp. DfronAA-171]|nr:syndecan 1 [Streptomyces sp. DfronAA-171]